jgi:hypothetical protein
MERHKPRHVVFRNDLPERSVCEAVPTMRLYRGPTITTAKNAVK